MIALVAAALAVEPTPVALATLARARELAGQPYRWGGRNTARLPGVDCLGVLFLGHAAATGGSWRHYPVDPTPLVASGRLGRPVTGLDGALRGAVAVDLLAAGDVLYFLLAETPIPDEPLWTREGVRYWPWHTGLYAGEGRVLQATPGGVVEERALDEIPWDALYVTRP